MVVQNPLDRVPGDVVAEIRERAVALIDRAAKRAGMSRSGFLTTAALTYAERDR